MAYIGTKKDLATGVDMGIDYAHHEAHSGTHYNITDYVDLAINNVRDIQITTPNTTKWDHFIFLLNTESETEWCIYEGVTINTPGTDVTAFNNDRNSANTSGLVIKEIDNRNVANANSDTDVSGATCIKVGITGSGKDAGVRLRSSEIILKQNTDYSIRFIANSAGFVNYDFEWYEHTNLI